jgi:hypothetical protein
MKLQDFIEARDVLNIPYYSPVLARKGFKFAVAKRKSILSIKNGFIRERGGKADLCLSSDEVSARRNVHVTFTQPFNRTRHKKLNTGFNPGCRVNISLGSVD